MCLSTAYEIVDGEPHEVCTMVSGAREEDGRVVLTDLMGAETSVEGRIQSIDLLENKIFVAAAS